jgi:RNA polymerase sigma factor (sigma-70 family)
VTADEHALIKRAQAGSSLAFSQLVDLHQQAIRTFLRRLTGEHAEADDLAQDVFVTAWTHLVRFDNRRSLRPWLFGLAYRKFLNGRRAAIRRTRRETYFAREQSPATVTDSNAALGIDLRKALEELPPEQRATVFLCLAAEFSHSEAAEALGLPIGTVKSHVQRGRAKLRALIGSFDDE